MGLLLRTALLLAVAAGAPAWAQPVERVPEFQVNTHTTLQQTRSHVVMADSGDFLVVWESSMQDGSNWGVFGRRLDEDAMPVGSEFQANTFTNGIQRIPAVAQDSTGNFVAVWVSFLQDGDGFGIFGQRFDAAGMKQGGEFQVNSYTTGFQTQPDVAMDSAGNFVVVWESYGQDGSSYGVFGQRYDDTGAAQGGEFQVNTHTTAAQYKAAIDMTAGGEFVVVWESFGQDGSGYGVFGRRFDSTATAMGPEFQANMTVAGQQGFPDVSLAPSGEFVVVWDGPDADGYGIFAQRFEASGAKRGGQIQVNAQAEGEQMVPSVAARDQDFVVAWQSVTAAGEEIFAQVLDGNGVRQRGALQLNTYTTDEQSMPSVAINPSGEWVATWTSDKQDGSTAGIFGRRFCSAPAVEGLMVEVSGGDLLLTWNDHPDAEDYEVFEDADPSGAFSNLLGTAASGAAGFTTPVPADDRYYFVSGRDSGCSTGP
jgi:hypothetical protein